MTWSGLSPEQATGVITHYRVAYEEKSTCGTIDIDDSTILTIEANLSAESYEQRLDGLVPGEEYCIAVSTNTSAGDSGFGDAVKINRKFAALKCLCTAITRAHKVKVAGEEDLYLMRLLLYIHVLLSTSQCTVPTASSAAGRRHQLQAMESKKADLYL